MLLRSLPGIVLIASYSGLLGGAERVLLDCATRLRRPTIVACPPGPLAEAVRTAGLRHEEITGGTLRLRRPATGGGPRAAASAVFAARHGASLAQAAWEIGALVHRTRPDALVAWSSRTVLATAAILRRPPALAVLHDIHDGALRAAVDRAARRADGVV